MNISAIQKNTLLDYPGKVACTIFLAGCNLRCPFCHNASLVLPNETPPTPIDEETFFSFLARRKGKLDGICITGGEPTMHCGLPDLMDRIHGMGFLVKLDTNGTHPDMLEMLIETHRVDYVAMDIKNSPSRYAETCGGIDLLAPIRESVRILNAHRVESEFRTTAAHPYHTPESIREIAQWIKGAQRYFLQSFVDSGHLVGCGASALTPSEMNALRDAALEDLPNTQIRGI